MGWTENLSQPAIRRIKAVRRSAAAKLQAALASPVVRAAAQETVKDISALLAFSSDDDAVGSGKIAEALEYLKQRGKDAGDLRYLEPGDGPFTLDGLDDVRVYVLGPPRDPVLLKTSGCTEKMSSPAPAILPAWRRSISAASFSTPPRARLIRKAEGFIAAITSRLTR